MNNIQTEIIEILYVIKKFVNFISYNIQKIKFFNNQI